MRLLIWSIGFLTLMMCGDFAFARGTTCEQRRAMVGNTQISTAEYPDDNICWIGVHPSNRYDTLIYRDFMFGNEGLLFVFNSFGEGPPSSTTGAREYYIFPRLQYPYFDVNPDENSVTVVMANQEAITFFGEDTRVKKMSGATFTEAGDISKNNKGGFELKLSHGVLLDCGFAFGNSPSANPGNTCKFSDGKNNICAVRARQVFDYFDTGDNRLKFKSDKELSEYLKKTCPKIDTSALEV